MALVAASRAVICLISKHATVHVRPAAVTPQAAAFWHLWCVQMLPDNHISEVASMMDTHAAQQRRAPACSGRLAAP
ncbi:hypothetical protein EYF80_039949 [Liparis tanakae]|uniref:Uncharacterized protein n=1 Tax=Liparis tanakae TaxID=230148 RepID=A0A4Z2G8I4_9TELE|nr:hypothetical protein EYF80_039949 [Liparis tanakae]